MRVPTSVRLALVVPLLASCAAPTATGGPGPAGPAAAPLSVEAPPDGVFGSTSEWRRVITDAPLAPDSEAMVADLVRQVEQHYGGVAGLNASDYANSFVTAPEGTERVDVRFDDCQDKGYTPEQLYDEAAGAHFADVPIPEGAVPSRGTDGQLAVWDPATDQLWEFWRTSRRGDDWYACWGGRIDDVSTSPGFFPDGMGSAATGLSYTGGMVRLEEARTGGIDHAMSLNLVDLAAYDVVSWPAQRSDGYNPDGVPHRIPEGSRLRLDPSVDVAALGLHPLAEEIARAAQSYGFIVTDKAGAVSVAAEAGDGVRAATGTDPWPELLGGTPNHEVLSGFPWARMQVLPMDYGRP